MSLPSSRRVLVAIAPFILGLIVIYVGFCLSPLWPAQDMPPELAARYARDFELSEPILKAGFVVTLFGLFWLAFSLIVAWRKSAARGPSKT